MKDRFVAWLNLVKYKLPISVRQLLTGSSIHKTLCYIEWTILVLTAIYAVAMSHVYMAWSPSSLIILPFLLVWFALSFIFPIDRPDWQKQLYIFVEIGINLILASTGWAMEVLMYFFLAKACFLLSRKNAIIAVILVGIIWQILTFISRSNSPIMGTDSISIDRLPDLAYKGCKNERK